MLKSWLSRKIKINFDRTLIEFPALLLLGMNNLINFFLQLSIAHWDCSSSFLRFMEILLLLSNWEQFNISLHLRLPLEIETRERKYEWIYFEVVTPCLITIFNVLYFYFLSRLFWRKKLFTPFTRGWLDIERAVREQWRRENLSREKRRRRRSINK